MKWLVVLRCVVYLILLLQSAFLFWKFYDIENADSVALNACFARLTTQGYCETRRCYERVNSLSEFTTSYLFPEWNELCLNLEKMDSGLAWDYKNDPTYYEAHLKFWMKTISCIKGNLGTKMDLDHMPFYSQCQLFYIGFKGISDMYPQLDKSACT